jgi:hypothetical protein
MTGTDRTELAPGDIFVIETPGGGGSVPQRGDPRGPKRGPARVKKWQEKQKSSLDHESLLSRRVAPALAVAFIDEGIEQPYLTLVRAAIRVCFRRSPRRS